MSLYVNAKCTQILAVGMTMGIDGYRALEVVGFVITISSVVQKYSRRQYTPWNYRYGMLIGILIGALGMWLAGGWFPA